MNCHLDFRDMEKITPVVFRDINMSSVLGTAELTESSNSCQIRVMRFRSLKVSVTFLSKNLRKKKAVNVSKNDIPRHFS